MNNLTGRAIRAALFGTIWFFAMIFIPAGTLAYWRGWAFFLTSTVCTTLATIYVARHDRKLLESRLHGGPAAEQTPAQKLITALGTLVFIPAIVIPVLDYRRGWSPGIPAWLSIFGDVLGALGILVYFFVVRENRYAAASVLVVDGQTVVSTGPYAVVRHPMYGGALLYVLGMPVALGSWWGLLFVPLAAGWFAWRLLNEEKFLREHLPGYQQYAVKVRYRLVPFVW
jgi:protein-S-isoprenylcysteine O-methyltransferase Ste14